MPKIQTSSMLEADNLVQNGETIVSPRNKFKNKRKLLRAKV